jgi:hypothetical protein
MSTKKSAPEHDLDRPQDHGQRTQAHLYEADAEVDGDPVMTAGTEIVDFVSMGTLVPSVQWIMENVVAKGKGFQHSIARMIGRCNKTERQQNIIPGKTDGPALSIKLSGRFEIHSLIDGQVTQAQAAYLPLKWAKMVEDACNTFDLEKDPDACVEMVLSLGVRATGKGIPYTWTVHTHLKGREDPGMDRLRQLAFGGPKPRLLSHGEGTIIDADGETDRHAAD